MLRRVAGKSIDTPLPYGQFPGPNISYKVKGAGTAAVQGVLAGSRQCKIRQLFAIVFHPLSR